MPGFQQTTTRVLIGLLCLCRIGMAANPQPAAPAAPDRPLSSLVRAILKSAGTTTGFCVDLGCGSGDLAVEISQQSKFFVHALETDDARVAAARRQLDATGLYGRRVAAEKGDLTRLPYPDYCANVIVRGDLLTDPNRAFSWKEALRVLRPGGLAYVGQSDEAAKRGSRLTAVMLRAQLTAAGVTDFQIIEKDGVWAEIRRPRPAGMADWSHGRWGTPGNNPCVDDKLVKAPFQTLWIAGPNTFTKFGLPLASNGRVLLRHGGMTHEGRWTPSKEGDLIQAFDAYNGARLWEYRLEQIGGDGFVAVGDGIYAAAGRTLYALNATDGSVRWSLPAERALAAMNAWGYFACSDNILVAGLLEIDPDSQPASAPRAPMKALLGLSPESGQVLWTVEPAGGTRSVALGAGRVFCAEGGGTLAALNIMTGKRVWSRKAEAHGGLRFHQGHVYSNGGVYSAADGSPTSARRVTGVLVGDRAFTGSLKGVSVTDLATGGKVETFAVPRDPYCPKTGVPDGCPFMYGRCIMPTASTWCYLFSYSGTVIGDLVHSEIFPCESFRSNCRTGAIAGNGLIYNSPSGCGCSLTVRGGIALVPVEAAFYWAKPESQPPPHLEKGACWQDTIAAPDDPKDWPCYRHDPARSSATVAAVDWPLAAAWKVRLPGRLTPPIIAGQRVFAGSDNHSVYALDAATGRTVWRYWTGGEIAASPACWQGRLYVGSQDGWVYCLRADSGGLVWRFRGGPHDRRMLFHGRPQSLWPIAGGVIVEGGVVQFYAGRCSHDRVSAYGLDARTGEVVWQNDKAGRAVDVTGPDGGISPHGVSPSGVIAAGKDILYVPQGSFAPAAFSRSDGRLLWWGRRGDSRQRSNIEVQNIGGPRLSLADSLLFVGGPDAVAGSAQPFVAVDARTGRLWGADDPRLFAKAGRDESGAAVVVKQSVFGTKPIRFGQEAAPVVVDGGVFISGYRGGFLDLKKQLETQFGPAPAGLKKWPAAPPAGPLVVAGDKVLVAAATHLTALARADGELLGRVEIRTEGPCIADGLAVGNGRAVLVTAAGEVACFGPK